MARPENYNLSPVAEAKECLQILESEWLLHMKRKHKGFPVANCHRCGDYKVGIRGAKDFIKHFEPPIN